MPSRLREEKVGMSGLSTDITLRLPEAVGRAIAVTAVLNGGSSGGGGAR